MAIKDAKIERAKAELERIDAEIDKIAQRILSELEGASSKDLSDALYAKTMLRLSEVHYAKRMLEQIGSVKKQSTGAIGKTIVMDVT
jgi:predicted transcriptional regulator